ncbi:MAG: hypothetical protein FWD88_00815 [Treponema sp.]|nr:hypothetical protein [Treponema sp.]
MPWRLIKFIAVFAVFLVFIILNLDNRSDISLGFTFRNVPVFLIVFCSLFLGMALTLPFFVAFWFRTRKGGQAPKKAGRKSKKGEAGRISGAWQDGSAPSDTKDYGID